jgi:hypothetical protein
MARVETPSHRATAAVVSRGSALDTFSMGVPWIEKPIPPDGGLKAGWCAYRAPAHQYLALGR